MREAKLLKPCKGRGKGAILHLCEATLPHSVFLSLPYQKENKTFEIYILIFAKIWIWQNNTNLEHK